MHVWGRVYLLALELAAGCKGWRTIHAPPDKCLEIYPSPSCSPVDMSTGVNHGPPLLYLKIDDCLGLVGTGLSLGWAHRYRARASVFYIQSCQDPRDTRKNPSSISIRLTQAQSSYHLGRLLNLSRLYSRVISCRDEAGHVDPHSRASSSPRTHFESIRIMTGVDGNTGSGKDNCSTGIVKDSKQPVMTVFLPLGMNGEG